MFKINLGTAPEVFKDIFNYDPSITCSLRNDSSFRSRRVNSVHHGLQSLSHQGSKIWSELPLDFLESKTIDEFKQKIKTWVPKKHSCRICCTYIQHLGFINVAN